MALLYNLARMTISSGGTGTLTLAGASPGYLTFDDAGVQDGDTVSYGIRDGANSETGTGVYTTATKTLTRSVTVSTNSNNAIDASLDAEVYVTARAEDLINRADTTTYGRSLMALADDDALAAEITDLANTWTAHQTVSTSTDTSFNVVYGTGDTAYHVGVAYFTRTGTSSWRVGVESSIAAGSANFLIYQVTDINGAAVDKYRLYITDGGAFVIDGTLQLPYDALLLGDSDASHTLKVRVGSNLTANRTLTLTTGDADRTLTMSGDATVSQDYSTTGNPQFATVELGHATDTTIARSGAGDITIEGNAVYRAGGTDVPVADGGTGASTLTGLLQGNGTSAFTAVTDSSTVGQVLRVTGASTYAWGALDLADSDAITGTLPVANGGTGQTTEAEAVGELIQALTADTTPDNAADYVATYDASADTGKKVLLSTLIREKLAADRTYYVRTDGSNSNTGLVDSAGGAWLTLQYAYDTIATTLDFNGKTVTIDVGNGTYTAGIVALSGWIGGGTLKVTGDETTPSNVVINGTDDIFTNYGNIYGNWRIAGIKGSTTSFGHFVAAYSTVNFEIANCEFGALVTGGIFVNSIGASVWISDDITISGNSPYFLSAGGGGFFITSAITATVSGTPAFSTAFLVATTGAISDWSTTFSGSATGTRYTATLNSVTQTYGGGANYFPGNAAGSTATGAQYA
jgi:hypothetical protein